MEYIFFDGWPGIVRIVITTVVAYFMVIIFLRISGKRTLAKMNAFDFVVTIALGSILSSVILNKSIPLSEGLLAIALLIFLQYILTFISVRSKYFKQLISSTPTILFYKQEILEDVLKKQRITHDEIHNAIREAGFSDYSQIFSIILETTGDITVIAKDNGSNSSDIMSDIENFDRV
ncbi:DUF421 domain-containing protein [Kaistella carnis]|uniref:DUF421 domain-containing protein n=1 Tax=Kaistella carnis TaxID=1241979 RepID=UPI0028B0C1DD|nr:YetF domain-containing protein [Kaistella carnis]